MAELDRIEQTVRSRLRTIRLSQGRSLDDVAGRAGLSPSTLSRIETGKRTISLDVLVPLRHVAWGANMNNSSVCAYGYGTAFTAPRHANRRSWLYRIRPSAMHGAFTSFAQPRFHNDFGDGPVTPDQLRWSPLPLPETPAEPASVVTTPPELILRTR